MGAHTLLAPIGISGIETGQDNLGPWRKTHYANGVLLNNSRT